MEVQDELVLFPSPFSRTHSFPMNCSEVPHTVAGAKVMLKPPGEAGNQRSKTNSKRGRGLLTGHAGPGPEARGPLPGWVTGELQSGSLWAARAVVALLQLLQGPPPRTTGVQFFPGRRGPRSFCFHVGWRKLISLSPAARAGQAASVQNQGHF